VRVRNPALAVCLLGFVVFNAQAQQKYLEEIRPSSEWKAWWHEAEQCIGRKLDINQVTFYIVHDTAFVMRGMLWVGWSDPFTREVFVTADSVRSKKYMQHEFAHQFMDRAGHPENPFITCGWSYYTPTPPDSDQRLQRNPIRQKKSLLRGPEIRLPHCFAIQISSNDGINMNPYMRERSGNGRKT